MSKAIYQLVDLKFTPPDTLTKVDTDLSSAYVLATASFLACAVPPSLSKKERAETWSRLSWRFILKATSPSVLDIGVTGLKYASVVFLPPSVVAIVKNSVQVVGIALISVCRGKRLTVGQALAIFVTIVGNGVVFCSSYLSSTKSTDGFGAKGALIGSAMVVTSGLLGAVRNVVEEVLLQDDGMTEGSLLLVESWISLACAVVLGLGLSSADVLDALHEPQYWRAFLWPWTATFFVGFLVTSYGKDLGKLKVTKHGGAVLAKVLSLLFPFFTWACTLLAYYISRGHSIGSGWSSPWSWMRLAGFFIISAGCGLYVLERSKLKRREKAAKLDDLDSFVELARRTSARSTGGERVAYNPV